MSGTQVNVTTHGCLDVRNVANYTLSNHIGLQFFSQRGQVEMLPDRFPA